MKTDGTNLSMYAGTTESITIAIEEDGGDVALETGDHVYFTIKEDIDDVAATLQKDIDSFTDDGYAVVTFDIDDTSGLDIGTYIYDIQVVYADTTKKQLTDPSYFTLLKAVNT